MTDSPDYYAILGIDRHASTAEIKQALRRLARQFHPDLNPGNAAAEERFKDISLAYEVLSDPLRRAAYDQGLPDELEAPPRSNSQSAYLEGIMQLAARDYTGALKSFNAALNSDPNHVDALLGRCQAHYVLGDDRAVLEDCYQLLQQQPDMVKAHYYQGRARSRLGYLQGAVEAYSAAIALDDDEAQAYYHRGLTRLNLKRGNEAALDLKKAAQLFREQGNFRRQAEAENALRQVQGASNARRSNRIPSLWQQLKLAITRLPAIVLNPSDHLLPAFARFKPNAAMIGVLYAILGIQVAIASFILGRSLGLQFLELRLEFLEVWLVGGGMYLGLAISCTLTRLLFKGRGTWASDCFLAGVVLFAFCCFLILNAIATGLVGGLGRLAAIIIGGTYLVTIQYIGCSQLSNIPERAALLSTGLILLCGSYVGWWLLNTLL